jgi:Fic family protein
VTATYLLASDPSDRVRAPTNGDELVEILRYRHSVLMAGRPDKHPGDFKQTMNFAGGYQFVEPALVAGTLIAGFDEMAGLVDPFARAVAMMILVTEVHPFDDGNGRVARLMANSELSRAGQMRIIIPTVYRNNYLAGLRAVSNARVGAARSLHSIMEFAQRWVTAVDWGDYDDARLQMEQTNAFTDPTYADSQEIRLELPKSPGTS